MNILKSRKKSEKDKEFNRLRKEVLKEFNRDYYKLASDVSTQVIAAVLYTLSRRCEFDKDDILDFIDGLNDTYSLMNGSEYIRAFNADDLKRQVKEDYGVDLGTFIKIGWSEEEKWDLM